MPQGTPKVDTQLLLARSAGSGKSQTSEELSNAVRPDPTLFCTRCAIFTISLNIEHRTFTVVNNEDHAST
jgi:hypothetical protein